MKQSVAFACFLLFACLSWAQPPYHTTWSIGLTDLTGQLATVNAWHAMPAKTLIWRGMGADLTIYDLDSAGCGWTYNWTNKAYTQQTSWGCGYSEISVRNGNSARPIMVALLKTDATCPSGTKRLYWWFGSGAVEWEPVCDAHLFGGRKDTQLEINQNGTGHTQLWRGAAGYKDMGTGFTAGYLVDSTMGCAIQNGNIYQISRTSGDFFLLQHQPGATATGCAIGNDVLFAWGSNWVKMYGANAGTWTTVTGLTGLRGMVTGPAGSTFAISSTGLPYHLNVYPGFITGTTSGALNGCPTIGNPCPGGTVHTGKIKVCMPGGMGPGCAGYTTQAVSPTTNMNVTSFTYSTGCDPIFDYNDGPCVPTYGGDVICSASGLGFSGGAGNSGPPPKLNGLSQNVMGFDDNIYSTYATPVPDGWIAGASCGATVNGCLPPTHAFCAPPNIPSRIDVILHIETNLPLDPVTVTNIAKNSCYDHDIAQTQTAWLVTSFYNPQTGGGPTTCKASPVVGTTKALWPCF